MRRGLSKYLGVVLLMSIGITGYSQDAHFSQYLESPSLINPGATGIFDGSMRFVLNYRNQWTTLNSNYQTTAAAFETALMKKKAGGNFLGVGLNVLSDKAGIGALKRLAFNLGAAYHLQINEDQNIGVGLQGGFAQRSIDPTVLTWDNQYNGSQYDKTLDSGEKFETSSNHINIGAGLHWSYEISNTADVNLGVGALHINQPAESFQKDVGDTDLAMKIVAHGLGRFTSRGSDLAFYPSFLFEKQGAAKEVVAGITMRYMLKESSKYTGFVKGNAVYFGANYRLGDAAIILLGLELSDWKLGISYDVNVSGFNKATGGVGGIEISLVWIKSD